MRAALDELCVVRVLAADVGHLRRDEDHALDAALEEHAHVVELPLRRAVRVAEDRREPGVRGLRLHRLRERGEHGVAELWDEEPDRVRGLDAPRRDIEEVAHRPLDTLTRRGAHDGGAARHAGRGGDAHSGPAGDVSKAGHGFLGSEPLRSCFAVSGLRNEHHSNEDPRQQVQ
jgi:hypothetical protein